MILNALVRTVGRRDGLFVGCFYRIKVRGKQNEYVLIMSKSFQRDLMRIVCLYVYIHIFLRTVGLLVGDFVGCFVGRFVGCLVGRFDGCLVGCLVGCFVGSRVGIGVGSRVGMGVGRLVGSRCLRC